MNNRFVMALVWDYIKAHPGLSRRHIAEGMGKKLRWVGGALEGLRRYKAIRVEGKTNTTRLYAVGERPTDRREMKEPRVLDPSEFYGPPLPSLELCWPQLDKNILREMYDCETIAIRAPRSAHSTEHDRIAQMERELYEQEPAEA